MLRKPLLVTLTAALVFLAATDVLVLAEQPLPAQGDQQQLIAVLQKAEAPLSEKAKACQTLAVVGTKECVPVLAGLLSDEKLSHYARYGLEPIADPSVDDALRDAIGKVKGSPLVGVFNSIGVRRDNKAVDGLKKFLGNPDRAVAAAAVAALGRVATRKSVQSLRQALYDGGDLRPAAGDACLTACDMLLAAGKRDEAVALYDAVRHADIPKPLRIAAAYGLIRTSGTAGMPLLVEYLHAEDQALFNVALGAARQLQGSEVTQSLVAELDKAPPQRRALLILAIGDRGDASALPAVLKAAKSDSSEVRLAAIRVLGQLGDAGTVPVLLDAALESETELAQAAQAGLTNLRGKEVDAAIVAMLGQGESKTRRLLIDVAGRRRIALAVPALFKAADSRDDQVRLAAIKALGTTIGLEDLPALTDRIIAPKTPQEKAAAQEALKAACFRAPDREACAQKLVDCLAQAPVPAKCFLLEVLGTVGGCRALETVSAGAKDANTDIQDAATRVLGRWMSVDAAPKLLDLAKSPSNQFRVRALRGYIRIVRQLKLPADQRLEMCGEAMAAAQRDEERKLVLEVLGRNPSADSLSLVIPHLQSAGLKEQASTAAVAIAEKIVQAHPAPVADAMKQVLQATSNTELTDRAKALLEQAQK